ncbi:hypothetical protein AALB_0165 [Agarivorans albus MKT 106]|uniref:Uncharacterized protein n=1 Tax=Agarivorans albus MKT 106 TaxID=1331007 RepID=R9PFC4_AGAAL|nr:hypothetical protein AALB_0165 [Agarivorans albus MKT 106]
MVVTVKVALLHGKRWNKPEYQSPINKSLLASSTQRWVTQSKI